MLVAGSKTAELTTVQLYWVGLLEGPTVTARSSEDPPKKFPVITSSSSKEATPANDTPFSIIELEPISSSRKARVPFTRVGNG
jgi:hypothetical protein